MTFRHNTRIWLITLLVAWIFDLFFWKQTPGVSVPIWFALVLASSIFILAGEGKRLAPAAWPLVGAALFFSFMVAFRAERFTVMMNLFFAIGALSVLAMTALGGQWLRYSLTDYLVGWLRLGWSATTEPLHLAAKQRTAPAESTDGATNRPSWLAPVLRGLLLAVPVVAILAALLASADPIFSARLEALLSVIRIEDLDEYLFRGFYIVIIAYVLIGVLVHARFHSEEEKLTGLDKPWLPPFLGIESSVILASVNLLFLAFVIIQFRYFFGGQANIHLDGFTYSEYARRGFGELVFVAIISLLLLLGLSGVTKRESTRQQGIFSGLGITLVLLVIVMLVSAFQRLQLYEAAYGFSRLRTYTHVFMIWLAVLLVATLVLEMVRRPRAFALALLLTATGFMLTINILNIDGFITRQNARLAVQNGAFNQTSDDEGRNELDTTYLVSLSNDAVPTLVELFQDPGLPETVHDQVGAVLACRADQKKEETPRTGVAFHFSDYFANQALAQVQPALAAYPISRDENQVRLVSIQGEPQACDFAYWVED